MYIDTTSYRNIYVCIYIIIWLYIITTIFTTHAYYTPLYLLLSELQVTKQRIVRFKCWRMLTHTSAYVSIHPHTKQRIVRFKESAGVCWRMLMYVDVCRRIPTHADACWRMLQHAGYQPAHCARVPQGECGSWKRLRLLADVCWRMLTYADVCGRMRTYAEGAGSDSASSQYWFTVDVCWRMRTYAGDQPAHCARVPQGECGKRLRLAVLVHRWLYGLVWAQARAGAFFIL